MKTEIQGNVDTLIIGAGLIGSAVAMGLAQKGVKSTVIDFDLEGTLSSSELNAGGVRATFRQPLNIDCSKLSIDYFAKNAAECGYKDCGYLWLHPPDRMKIAIEAAETQRAHGWPVEVWDIAELTRKRPWIDKLDGLAGAVFAPRDGLINPNLLKNHFRNEAKKSGASFIDGCWLERVEAIPNGGFQVRAHGFKMPMDSEQKRAKLSGDLKDQPTSTRQFEWNASRIVNCGGAWAPEIAKTIGYHCPSHPVRRQVCIFDAPDFEFTGMVIDTAGIYFHPEATHILAGFAHPNEAPGKNFHYDGESFFMETIWPALYERSTKFERLKHLSGWSGLYEVSPDESAIIGEVDGSFGKGRVFEAHSFSGHGVMHSYATGIALSELMTTGKYQTLDLNRLSATRFRNGGRSLGEDLVI